jgi:hypothetical protein
VNRIWAKEICIPVRLSHRDDVELFATHATELPPSVWGEMLRRVPVA